MEAIMVAPDCPDKNWETQQSEICILSLLDFISRSYPIDLRRCLIVGYSMGAKGSWSLAARHHDKFSAMIPISALPPEGMSEIYWQIPLYVIHSKHDERYPLKTTQEVVKQLQRRGVDIELYVVKGVTHYNVGGFVRPLQGAIPWIKHVWAKQSDQHLEDTVTFDR
jgi:predicted peptidase